MVDDSGMVRRNDARRLVVGLVLGMLLTQSTNSMLAVAVPTIIDELGAGLNQAGWIISAYLLPVAVMMPTWGAAGDLYGRRRIFRIGLIIFAVGAAITGLAGSLPILLMGQVVQATGASALQPNGMALIAATGGDQGRARALGRLRMVLSLAGIAGAPAGGLLVQFFGWHAIFLAAPVLAPALSAWLGRFGPEVRRTTGPVRFDTLGAVLLTVTMLAWLVALSLGQTVGWTAPLILLPAGLAVIGLTLLAWVEARQPRPLIPLALFGQPALVAVIVTGFFQAIACFGTALLGPLLLQRVFELEPGFMGWLLAGFPLGMALSGIPGGALADRFGGQWVTAWALIGTVASLLGLAGAAWLVLLPLFVPAVILGGFAAGVGLVAMGAFVLQVSGSERGGIAMGVYTMISIIGDIVGVALLPILLAGQTGVALAAAFGQVYLVAAAVALIALLPVLAMRVEQPARLTTTQPGQSPEQQSHP